jgi:mannose-1-phosphate guanylyltransferase / mannose-6-phosphate isomerase
MKHIILAGGSGTRLWPFSTECYPKQFLHFGDHETLLQKTVKRFYPIVPAKDILVITGASYYDVAKAQLTQIDSAFEKQILVEPEKRNTAPAIALGIKYFQDVLRADPYECVLVSSADHIISPEEQFLFKVKQGEELAQQGNHVIFGIRPNKPETGYGYIKTKKTQKLNFLEVEKFVEKPDYPTAQLYILSGQYLWNAGIFLFQIHTFLQDIQLHNSKIDELLQGSFENTYNRFSEMPNLSIDYALLEKSERLLVEPLDVSWSDVGSWDSIYDLLEKDSNHNVKVGNVLDMDTNHCLIVGNRRLISTVGLEDLIIVDTDDALFIGKKGQSQMVKNLVEEMKRRAENFCPK